MPGSPSGSSSTGGGSNAARRGRRDRGGLLRRLGLGRRLRGAFRLRELVALPRAERLLFLARDIVRIGSVLALELEMLTDGVVEESHGRRLPSAYSALTVRFLPDRFAR